VASITPGSTWADLSALDVAAAKHAQCRHIAYPDILAAFSSVISPRSARSPSLVVIVEAAHAFLRPRIAMASFDADAIEQAHGDQASVGPARA